MTTPILYSHNNVCRIYAWYTCRYLPQDLSQQNSYWKKIIFLFTNLYTQCVTKFSKSSSCFVHGRKNWHLIYINGKELTKSRLPIFPSPGEKHQKKQNLQGYGVLRVPSLHLKFEELISYFCRQSKTPKILNFFVYTTFSK